MNYFVFSIIGHIQVSGEMRPVYKGTRDWIRTGACFYFTPGGNKAYLNAAQKTRIFLRKVIDLSIFTIIIFQFRNSVTKICMLTIISFSF